MAIFYSQIRISRGTDATPKVRFRSKIVIWPTSCLTGQ
jgi:hypothetical protein